MRAVLVTMRAAFAEAFANRAAFWWQVAAMVINDVAWVIFWVIFFREVGDVRGWDTDRVLLLLAVLTTSAGFVLGVLSNARRVGSLAAGGELDSVLALPVSPLAHLLVRRVDTVNLGDCLFGVVLFAVAGDPSLERTAIFLTGVVAGVVLLCGFLVATGSLAFFAGKGEAGELGMRAILLLATYPVDIFSGAAKVLLYTAVPAAFVAAVPARLVDAFDAADALLLLGVSALFGAIGVTVFTLGLRRYTSGSIWTRA